MSSILKALKKLEAEKSAQKDGSIDIANDILRVEQRPGHRRRLLYPIVAVAVVSVALSLLLLRGKNWFQPAPQVVKETNTPPVSPAPAEPSPPSRLPQPDVQLPAATPAPNRAEESVTILMPPAKYRQTERRPAPATAPPVPLPPPTVTVQTPPPAVPPPAAEEKKPAPPPVEPVGPTLSVSGIAWQKDSANRLAIVNGQPLATGTTIEGVVIEEIMPDRVRFSHNRKSFEVFLGKSGKAN